MGTAKLKGVNTTKNSWIKLIEIKQNDFILEIDYNMFSKLLVIIPLSHKSSTEKSWVVMGYFKFSGMF